MNDSKRMLIINRGGASLVPTLVSQVRNPSRCTVKNRHGIKTI